MTALAWYDGPAIGTSEELAELDGRYRLDSLIVSYANWLENRACDDGLAALSAREQLVVGGAVFEREINSGGFEPVLDDYRAYLDTAKLCMCAIGKPELAQLISEANAAFQTNPDDTDALTAFEDRYHEFELDLADDLIRLAVG